MVDFGDKSIDLSVSSRVNKLNNVLQGMSRRPPGFLYSYRYRIDITARIECCRLSHQFDTRCRKLDVCLLCVSPCDVVCAEMQTSVIPYYELESRCVFE